MLSKGRSTEKKGRRMDEGMIGIFLKFALWLLKIVTALSRSNSGYSNPLTKRLTPLGYALSARDMLYPNIRKWQQGSRELFPSIVQVQTINRCNGSCIMCPYPYTVHLEKKALMENITFSKIVEECTREDHLQAFIPMAQTEPLLDPKLAARIREFKSKSTDHQRVELVTNGTLLTEHKLQELVDSGLDIISISVNATNERTYLNIMKGLSWEKVMANLEAISKRDLSRVNIFVRFIKQKDNYKEFQVFKKYWRNKSFNVLGIEVNNRSDSLQAFTDIKVPDNTKTIWKTFVRKNVAKKIFPVCPYAFSHMHILHNGDVPLCINDFEHREIIGNIHQNTMKEIYNSKRFHEVRTLMSEGKYDEIETCRHCTLWNESNWL